jgi:prenylcysteine oxidase/farnesylcysteine lyase
VNAYNATDPPPEGIVELGASIFVTVNHILVNATDAFNLTTTSFSAPTTSGPRLGIYNGEAFVFTQNAGTAGGIWDGVKLFWRYGYAPIKTMNLMKDVVGRFLEFYKAPTFPFVSLNSAVVQRGLSGVVAATGEQWLKENGVGELFANEVVQAR